MKRGKKVAQRDRHELIEVRRIIKHLSYSCEEYLTKSEVLLKADYWTKKDLETFQNLKTMTDLLNSRDRNG
jgi:hypothetical protein